MQAGAHHVAEVGEAVESVGVFFGEYPDWVTVAEDHDSSMGALVDQCKRVGNRGVYIERNRSLKYSVTVLYVINHSSHNVDRNILWENRDAAATRNCFGHSPPGHRGHVRYHEGNGRADRVGSPQLDIHSRWDIGNAGHHKHVVIGQVETWVLVEHAHCLRFLLCHGPRRQTPL